MSSSNATADIWATPRSYSRVYLSMTAQWLLPHLLTPSSLLPGRPPNNNRAQAVAHGKRSLPNASLWHGHSQDRLNELMRTVYVSVSSFQFFDFCFVFPLSVLTFWNFKRKVRDLGKINILKGTIFDHSSNSFSGPQHHSFCVDVGFLLLELCSDWTVN